MKLLVYTSMVPTYELKFSSKLSKNTISPNTMSVFQKNVLSSKVSSIRSLMNPWRLNKLRSNRFRSYFGFFKQKIFLTQSIINLTSVLKINSKNHKLSSVIRMTKRYTTATIDLFFKKHTHSLVFSDQGLKNLIKKSTNFSSRRLFYTMYRHKIHKYTTAKRFYHETSSFFKIVPGDFRTNIKQAKVYPKTLNVDTISTYNWKTIN